MTPLARRATTALTSLLVIAAGLAATGAATPPAQAAPVTVTDATFLWDLNDESTSGAFAPSTWNYFSAGRLGDPGESTTINAASQGATWSNGRAAGWKAQAGNVTVEDLQTGGSYAVASFAGTRTNTAGATANTANPPVRGETRLAFAAGTGTLDPEADDASIAWDGDATVVYYSGFSFFYVSDPRLTLDGGTGTVTATLGGYGSDMVDTDKWVTLPETQVTLATIEGADVTATGVVATPTYLGVAYTTPEGGSPQVTSGAAWGSFPTSFVDFQQLVGTASYWYSSGGSADVRKPTNPLRVALGYQPARQSSTVAISAPARRFGQAATATVTVTSAGSTAGTIVLKRNGATVGTVDAASGRATFSLGRPAAGRYSLTAGFAGNTATAPSTGSSALTVGKAATTTTARLRAKPTTTKAGKLEVTVASPTTTPAGKARIVLKKGARTVKTITATLKNRTATVALPKGARAAYRAVVTYLGTADVGTSARTVAYKITT